MGISDDVEGSPCPMGHKTNYSVEFDAFYCASCNQWAEPACRYTYPDCVFNCANRPSKPCADFGPYPSERFHVGELTANKDPALPDPAWQQYLKDYEKKHGKPYKPRVENPGDQSK